MAERGVVAGGRADFGVGIVGVDAADDGGNGADGGGGKARPMGLVLIGFFLRLGLALVLLYVSLKYSTVP